MTNKLLKKYMMNEDLLNEHKPIKNKISIYFKNKANDAKQIKASQFTLIKSPISKRSIKL